MNSLYKFNLTIGYPINFKTFEWKKVFILLLKPRSSILFISRCIQLNFYDSHPLEVIFTIFGSKMKWNKIIHFIEWAIDNRNECCQCFQFSVYQIECDFKWKHVQGLIRWKFFDFKITFWNIHLNVSDFINIHMLLCFVKKRSSWLAWNTKNIPNKLTMLLVINESMSLPIDVCCRYSFPSGCSISAQNISTECLVPKVCLGNYVLMLYNVREWIVKRSLTLSAHAVNWIFHSELGYNLLTNTISNKLTTKHFDRSVNQVIE